MILANSQFTANYARWNLCELYSITIMLFMLSGFTIFMSFFMLRLNFFLGSFVSQLKASAFESTGTGSHISFIAFPNKYTGFLM
jgi:hypothetical protein